MESACRNSSSKWKQWSFLVGVLVLGAAEADNAYRCGPGIITPGVTIPTGDIILEYGSPLEIFCVLKPDVVNQGFNSSHLVFYHTSHRLLPEFITLVNESTARLYVEKPVPMKDMFYCKLINGTQESPVCLNSVTVGFRPQEVQNFSCISHNWDNLNCSWVPPLNYAKTKYTLVYHLPGRAGSRLKYRCPNETDIKGKNYCYWDQTTNNPYRQPYEYYYFVITGNNSFGTNQTKIRFHHYAYVIPTKAANLTLLEKTSNRALIQWSVVFPMQNFPPGVIQKVEYQSEWDPRDYWTVVDTKHLNIKNATHQLNITGLKYANSLYDIRVFMRSPMALGEDMWSQPATLTIKTKPTLPGAAPKTDIGSFEVPTSGLTSRDIYVYWQHIPEYQHNGEGFGYQVRVEEDGVPRKTTNNKTTSAYMTFRSMSLNSYRFKIVSVNQEGMSEDYSEVYVPSQTKILGEPQSFTKIAFDNHIYELSWKPPNSKREISNYTIFWCDNNKDRPYQCNGTLKWKRVPRHVTIMNMTMPDDNTYQFAISANTESESSGMSWASCTVIHNMTVGKMKSIWINRIGPTFIEVGWKLDCSDRIGVVTGFVISYCPIVSPHNTICKGSEKNTTIKGDGNSIRGNITNLTPYSTYMVKVAVITKNSIGRWSDQQFNTTLEAAPDMPPQNVTVSDVTNTTMLVKWSPPLSMNGVLRYYVVHYNGMERKVEGTEEAPNTRVFLNNLRSFVIYNISVSACTVACSAPSQPVEVMTKIGCPGRMDHPNVTFVNSSQVEVKWKPPSYTGGLLDRYEVKVEVIDNTHNITEILNCTGNQSQIPIEDCNSGGPHHIYSFSVRAVNYANNIEYYGPWSEPTPGNCFITGAGAEKDLWIIAWVVICFVLIFFVCAIVIVVKQLWERYEQMRTIEVKLPPGLENVIEKSVDPDYHLHLNLYGWSPPTAAEKQEVSPPDQELNGLKLLLRMKESSGDQSSLGEVDGDSSGCSSGHESVSSSFAGGTHMSSDSGTEADQLHNQRASSLVDVFTDSASSLRQRNKPASTNNETSTSRWERGEPYVMLGGLVKSAPNLNEAEGTGYSLLGGVGAAWRPTPNATGYVSLQPAPPMPPTYKEPSAPSKGYVMAGETDPPMQYCRLDHSNYVPHS